MSYLSATAASLSDPREQGRQRWLRSRERRRLLVSTLAVLLAYVLCLLTVWLVSLIHPRDYTNAAGPVVIRLGRPEGIDLPTPAPEATALPQPVPVTPPAPQPPVTAVTPPSPAPAPATPVSTPEPKPATVQTPVPKPATPAPAVTPTVAAPPVTVPQQTVPVVPSPPQPEIVRKGSEAGNSYDLSVMGGDGKVGFAGGIPLYLFMPIPFELPDSLFLAIPDKLGLPGTAEERRRTFMAVYQKTGDRWRLKANAQPDYEVRIAIWPILEDSGYNLAKAEYKDGKFLRPVELSFTILPAAEGARLVDVRLVRSSGYGDIDEAVLAGLRHPSARFSNTGDRSISGTFTYRFQ